MEMTETKLEENRSQDLGVEVQDDAIGWRKTQTDQVLFSVDSAGG